jgi:hypothetical protein
MTIFLFNALALTGETMALYVVKTVLELTREEAAEIALRFSEILENPDVTTISLFFNRERIRTTNQWKHQPEAHPFIAVE